jgi:hypothetical protein
MAKDDASRMGEQIRMRKRERNGVCVWYTQSEAGSSCFCAVLNGRKTVATSYTTRQSGSFVQEETERFKSRSISYTNFFHLPSYFSTVGIPSKEGKCGRKNREMEKGKLDFITLSLHGLKNEMARMRLSQGWILI